MIQPNWLCPLSNTKRVCDTGRHRHPIWSLGAQTGYTALWIDRIYLQDILYTTLKFFSTYLKMTSAIRFLAAFTNTVHCSSLDTFWYVTGGVRCFLYDSSLFCKTVQIVWLLFSMESKPARLKHRKITQSDIIKE